MCGSILNEHSANFDVAVIGAGIAGSSLAAELAKHTSVVLIEMEGQPGYHTTGRSAAFFAPTYGPQPIRALTRASFDFFRHPPDQFCDVPLLAPRDVLMVARSDQVDTLRSFLGEVSESSSIRLTSADEARSMHPLLRSDYVGSAAIDTGSREIDVSALHHGYLRSFKSANGTLQNNCRVLSLQRNRNNWLIQTNRSTIEARLIVNTAGAWADEVGQMAEAEPIGLVPKRRTVMMVDMPGDVDPDSLPMVVDIDEEFYMKPETGGFLISPANEDPMPPCDVQPEEIDIARCIERIETAFEIRIGAIRNKWAGLRSFVPDKCPVVGHSAKVDGFFWLAGQGGYGIQTAPALARYAAAVALEKEVPTDLVAEGLAPSEIQPDRLHSTR
ncbi:MAG: NAD(P)/FAD-dependent oxidoreductase [Rhizobiaceae bacterium]